MIFRAFIRSFLILTCLFAFHAPAHAAKTLMVLGDSLSAGYGMPVEKAWPSLLQRRLQQKGLDYNVANLSISGETTAGGRARLPDALNRLHPAIVIIALGANDGLRGLPINSMQDNLQTMIRQIRQQGGKVVLVAMQLPPNYGPYANTFNRAFREVAAPTRAHLTKFLLEGIAANPNAFQADGLHPTADVQPLLLDNVWPTLQSLL